MNRDKLRELINTVIDKTVSGLLEWEKMHEQDAYRASLGEVSLLMSKGGLHGGSTYGKDWVRFTLADRRGDVIHVWNVIQERDYDDVDTAQNSPEYNWALEAWEIARSSAMEAGQKIEDALDFLSKLKS